MRRWVRKKTDVKFKQRRLYLSYSSAEEPNPLTTPSLLPCVDSWVQEIFRSHGRKHRWEFKMFCQALTASISCGRLCVSPPGSCPHRYQTSATHHSHFSQGHTMDTGVHNKVSPLTQDQKLLRVRVGCRWGKVSQRMLLKQEV